MVPIVLKVWKSHKLVVAGLVALLFLAGIACGDDPTPTRTSTAVPAGTGQPTATPTSIPNPTAAPQPPATATSIPAPRDTPVPPGTPTLRPTDTPQPTPAPALFPLTITDSSGNDIVFDKPPERILAYDSDSVEILFAMGEGHRIAGTHDFVDFPPETASIPRFGNAFQVNGEKVLELDPDLIYTFYEGSLPDLQNLGLKLLYIKSLNSNLDDVMEHFRLWGKITGNPEAAEREVAKFQARLDTLKERLEAVDQGPRVYQHGFDFWVPGGDTLMGAIYELLKADLVTKEIQAYKQISPEEIVVKDPQVIVASGSSVDQVTGHDAFQNVTAVKDGRILLPEGTFAVAGPRLIESIEELAGLLYPDIFGTALPTAPPTPQPTPAPALFPLTITDSSGNDIVFDKPPERILAYDSDSVEILFAMGEGHRIAGTHDFVDFPPETANIPRFGNAFQVNGEKVLELAPDLIYTFYEGSLPDLQNLGLKLLYIKSLNSNLDDVMEHFRLWGKITGNPKAAEREVAKFQVRLDALKERLDAVDQGPRVYQHGFDFWVPGGDTLMGAIYELLKADLVTKEIQAYKQISPEEIVVKDPQVIVASGSSVDQVTGHDAFQNVTAVKDGRILLPKGTFAVAGPRLIESIEELAGLLYPDIFQ